jgi:hypothetical protein
MLMHKVAVHHRLSMCKCKLEFIVDVYYIVLLTRAPFVFYCNGYLKDSMKTMYNGDNINFWKKYKSFVWIGEHHFSTPQSFVLEDRLCLCHPSKYRWTICFSRHRKSKQISPVLQERSKRSIVSDMQDCMCSVWLRSLRQNIWEQEPNLYIL